MSNSFVLQRLTAHYVISHQKRFCTILPQYVKSSVQRLVWSPQHGDGKCNPLFFAKGDCMARQRSRSYGPKIDPRPVDRSITVTELIDQTFQAYNAARLREAAQLFTRKMLEPDV